jgi:hypothetical protein
MSDEHPLDEPLGVIHEAAILLAKEGYCVLAMQIAYAHDQIQEWALKEEE